jgi:hypothetical protein
MVEVDDVQLGELPDLRRDGACQRISSHKTLTCRLVYHSINLSKTVLTGQFVVPQQERRHASAEPELRRDVACTATRSF